MRLAFLLALAVSPVPVLADGCPTAPDHSAALESLFAEVQSATNDRDGAVVSDKMWALWTDAPDEPSQAMLDQGMAARSSFDFLKALERFDRLVDYCPHYAEGYNQRAFVNYLREDYAAALPDLDRALDINPQHVGALSGKALTLMALGREDEAQIVLRLAVALNPWLGERVLLKPVPGKDL